MPQKIAPSAVKAQELPFVRPGNYPYDTGTRPPGGPICNLRYATRCRSCKGLQQEGQLSRFTTRLSETAA